MGQKTYAFYNNKIYNWVDLLEELNLDHNNNLSAHVEYDKYRDSNKELPNIKVMIKKEDGNFVEAVKTIGEYVEDVETKQKVILSLKNEDIKESFSFDVLMDTLNDKQWDALSKLTNKYINDKNKSDDRKNILKDIREKFKR